MDNYERLDGMVYRLLGLVTVLIVLIFLIDRASPVVAGVILSSIVVSSVILVPLWVLWMTFDAYDDMSQRPVYGRYIRKSALRIRENLNSCLLPFVHGGLIILTQPFALLAMALPYIISILVVAQVVVASVRYADSLPAEDVSNLWGALAVVIAIFAISLTMVPAYIGLTLKILRRIRVAQGRYIEGSFMFGCEELTYEAASDRLFTEDPGVKSRGCARDVLDNLRAGVLEGYKYVHSNSPVFVEYSPPMKEGLRYEVCIKAYIVMYKPHYLTALPRRKRNRRYAFTALNWLAAVIMLGLYGLFLYFAILHGILFLIARFVDIYFPGTGP